MDSESMPPEAASELVSLFKKAESQIKNLELLYNEGLFFHPVNQLRYAGYHIVRAMEATDQGEKEDGWNKAKNHCKRAIYDASEMSVVYCLEEINSFQKDYKNVVVTSVITNYLDMIQDVRRARDIIKSTDHETRLEKYNECIDLFEVLKPHVERLNDARPELNKLLQAQRQHILLAALGIFVAIIIGIITL